jgi:hypothetical protein
MVIGRARLPWLLLAAALIGFTVGAAWPSATSADDGCGGVEEAFPSHHPRGRLPPLAIGDSTMLLALGSLAAEGYDANAHGCREWWEAQQLIEQRKAEGKLPHMVVIALGADGSVTRNDIGETLGWLCCTRLLVLVTNRELGGWSGSDAQDQRDEARKHANRTKLLDWVAYSAAHPDWFQPDGLHLTDVGAQAFARFLGRAMKWAYPPKKHKRRHRPSPA